MGKWRLGVSALIAVAAFPLSGMAAFDSADQPSGGPLEIIRVTPDGEDVPAGKQIVIQFNRAVVPVGKMERDASEIPVTITPDIPCEWRWINDSALSCNLPDKEPLRPATRYGMEIRPGIKAQDGATLAAALTHNFTTERPDVRYKEFRQWKGPGTPVLRLVFNQPVDKESVRSHVYFAVGDKGEGRMGLNVAPDPQDRELPQIVPVPGEKYALIFKKSPPQKSDDDTRRKGGGEARRIWVVEPSSALPLDTHVVLKTEPGLISALGPEAGNASSEVVQFDTYPAFAFLGIICTANDETPLTIPAGQDPKGKCNPMAPVHLSFSAPVERSRIGKMLHFSPSVSGWGTEPETFADEEGQPEVSYLFRQPHAKGKTYEVWLPSGLKAAQEYQVQSRALTLGIFERIWHWIKSWFTVVDPIDAQDMFGRELAHPFSARFATDHRNPNYVLDYRHAVIEQGVDSEVPFYVNNLKNYTFTYDRLTPGKVENHLSYTRDLPEVPDVQYAVPFGVRDMLQGKSGAVFGTLASEPRIARGQYEPPHLFAQVTPYQVHFKLGHFNSVVWVTDLASGAPVAGASVALYEDALPHLQLVKKANVEAVTNDSGVAILPGTDTLDPRLDITRRYRDEDSHLFVRVQKGDGMALLMVSPDYMIDSYRSSGSESVYPSNKQRYGHMRAWGTTAQGIYRAGDTIQYKIYVRNQDNDGFVSPPPKGYELKIIDPAGKVVHSEKAITLSAFGGVGGEFTVPKEGAVGWYSFKLSADFAARSDDEYDEADEQEGEPQVMEGDKTDRKSWVPMRVLVSDFTPAAFRVTNQLNGDLFRSGQQVDAVTHAELHSGGPYTDASVRLTAMLDSRRFTSKHPLLKDFQFDSYTGEAPSQQLFQKIDRIGDKGELSLSFPLGAPKIVYGKLTVESAVADDRGKYVTAQARADYVGVDRLVGLHATQWLYEVGKEAKLEYAVADERGNPAPGTPVEIALEHEVSKAARVKGAGSAYLTEYHNEWEAAGSCKGVSEAAPRACSFVPAKAGVYRAVAHIRDSRGTEHSTTLQTYAMGDDFVVWNDESDTSLTIVPERTDYKVGDTARYLVKNPYPGAKALVTVERYGVLDTFVKTFDSSTPVVEFPIKPEYLPGFYLSVVIMSPRVEKPLGEGQVDLGKPSFRMGYVTVPVQDPYKDITVTAKADKEVYKPREKVTVSLHAQARIPEKKEPIELTVAVLDESVFDLVAGGKKYFDPYDGFYRLESLDLRNYSLLTRLVGRQKFEKKGANPGGDGGADLSMRSLFKFVSYWNAGLATDKDGNATVSFDAPDNLTGWRILALAATPSDRFGLGDANFKVNRPTEVRPVMPNQVMEGDKFDAGFSVMNRTDTERELTVTITAEGNIDSAATPATLTKTLTLPPYKRATVFMPVQVSMVAQKAEQKAGSVNFSVTAGDAADTDGLKHALSVLKLRTLDVAATYGTTTENKIEEPIAFPKEMLPDVGGVSVVASPTVIGNVAGAFAYMRDYPYMCWEQKLSKGVMAAHFRNLKAYLPATMQWEGSDALPQATLDAASGFQAPNGGMSYFEPRDDYADPYLSAYTALAFGWLRKSGYQVPEEVENKLHDYLGNILRNNTAPDFYTERMTSTVRAVALAALAEKGGITLDDLERYRPHVHKMSLLGKAYFLQAAMRVEGGGKFIPDVANMILARSSQSGGKFVFSEEWDDSYARILASPLRENCAVLDVFVALGEREDGKKLAGDVPFKLVRAIAQDRKNRDHWENTQENMFCMNALIDFARAYEKEPPDMRVTASMDGAVFGKAAFHSVRDPAATLERPVQAGDAGRTTSVAIERSWAGRLYYAARLAYALPVSASQPANSGIEIHREYSVERAGKWELVKTPEEVNRGELVRVDLYVSAPAARNFVVVDDPVPGGLEPVNRDLATASAVDADKGAFQAAGGAFWFKFSDWIGYGVSRWSFYHQEMRHDSVRFYSDYLPPGNYHLSYTAQAVATGSFAVLPAQAGEMYDPDIYGKTSGLTLHVLEANPQP